MRPSETYLVDEWAQREVNLPAEINNLDARCVQESSMIDQFLTQLARCETRAKNRLKEQQKERRELDSLTAFKAYRVRPLFP